MYQEADWMALGPTTYAIHVTGMSTRCSVKSVCSVCTVFLLLATLVDVLNRATGNENQRTLPKKKAMPVCIRGLETRGRSLPVLWSF